MHESNGHVQHQSDDSDRTNRFLSLNHDQSPSNHLRERAASQPPRTGHTSLFSPLYRQPSFGATAGSPWGSGSSTTQQQRFLSGLSPGSLPGLPSSVPTRSSSFSSSPNTSTLSSMMREQYRGGFPSTFEDDESEVDTYDERFIPQSIPSRGRTYASDLARSRSQSLATTRPTPPIGSPYEHNSGLGPSWQQADSSFPQNVAGSGSGARYGDIGSSRYGALGPLRKQSSSHIHSRSPPGGDFSSSRHQSQSSGDISNMSPFMRDVEQILLDDGSAFRELWAGMHPPRDENGAGGSGTTSRRHSVSVVQPRRGIVGFNAPGLEGSEESNRPGVMHSSSFSGGGLLLTDDDLVGSLNMLNLNGPGPSSSSSQHPPSQPSSLPIYAPLSRHPPSQERMSPYQQLNLNIPTNGGQYISRQAIRSPSENGYSASGTSPARSSILEQALDSPYQSSARLSQLQQQGALSDNLISPSFSRPAYTSSALPTPISPSSTRGLQHGQQQQAFYTGSPTVQRRSSNAELPTVSELGRGIPLSSVPPACPLYIVEFKAGRTDLFYCTDLSMDIRIGDLVIVEADRGKDLGKVVNDSITLAEVEAFQRQQQARAGAGAGYGDSSPTTPGGPGSGKKDINPKRIYGKAQPQDTQLLVTKMQDEVKALQLCQSKVRQKKLPMEVIDAEYQWDRRKLTFYFIAEKRIDFRELVRELFRLYKTRIWMASLGGPGGFEQQ